MRALLAIFSSQARLFLRDRVTVAITILLPLVLSVFFAYVFGPGQPVGLRMGIVNSDTGATSSAIVKGLSDQASDSLAVTSLTLSDVEKVLSRGDLDVVLVIPSGFSDAVAAGRTTEIQAVTNAGKSTNARVAVLAAQSMVASIMAGLTRTPQPVTLTHVDRSTGPPPLGTFYVPNFLAVSILWLSIFATAIPIVKQREEECLLRISLAPVSKATFMAGVTLWRLFVGVVQSLLFLTVAIWILQTGVPERWPLLAAAILLGNLVFTVMGYMIAGLSRSMSSAEGLSQVVNFSMLFLSGILFPPGMLPDVVANLAYAMPLSYLADTFRQTMVNYPGVLPLEVNFAALAGFGLVCTAISLRVWRWR